MKHLLFTLLLLGFVSISSAQLNDYKYVIVPKKFEVFKEENLYQTSTLIKYLFKQEGFNVVYNDELPADLENNPCLGVTADLEKNSSLVRSKYVILMKDCYGVVVFRSVEGSSKAKDFKKAYHESIRQSFEPFIEMDYQYKAPDTSETALVVSYKDDIKSAEAEAETTTASQPVIVQVATPEEQSYKSMEPVPSKYKKAETSEDSTERAEETNAYNAREVSNGYELLDENSEVWLTLYQTSSDDVYLAKGEEENGMVYKKDGNWYFEYYQESELVVQELFIKFQ